MKFVFLQDPNTRVNAWQYGEVDGGWEVPSNAYASCQQRHGFALLRPQHHRGQPDRLQPRRPAR